jgi:hypothetical protein
MTTTSTENALKVADEVWIATALLHKEHPSASDFKIEDIVERAQREHPTEALRPGVYIHAQMHCVANKPPNPGRYRMLFETPERHRRLFIPGDVYDRKREGAKTIPVKEELPEKYRPLLDWYSDWSRSFSNRTGRFDALLALRGSGRDLWADEHADEYVNRLREGWE